jgi:hypothetical protein
MDFRPTPINVVMMLLVALAVYALMNLFKRRLDSNIPLVFYCAAMAFMASTGRELNTVLFLAGLGGALVLRFEFMNRWVTNVVWAFEVAAMGGIAFLFAVEVLGIRLALPAV